VFSSGLRRIWEFVLAPVVGNQQSSQRFGNTLLDWRELASTLSGLNRR
jgi:hypothetical protein